MLDETETAPLLGSNPLVTNDAALSPLSTLAAASNSYPHSKNQSSAELVRKISILVGLVIVFADLADFMRTAPKLRLFELSICRDYYGVHDPSIIGPDGSVPEMFCKIEEVQSELAMLKGWLNIFEGMPSLLVAIPYGILAESKGRRFVVALNMVGQFLGGFWIIAVCYFHQYLPIKAVWASGAFQLIGGGGAVIGALTFAMVADVAPANQRSTIFFFFSAAMLIAEIVAPIIGSLFLNHGFLYLPMLIGIPLELSCFFLVWLLPETSMINQLPKSAKDDAENESLVSNESSDIGSDLKSKNRSMKQSLLAILRPVFSIGLLAFKDIRLTLALIAFAVNKLQRQLLDMIVQYASKRLNWSVAKAGYLVSVRAGINICVLLLILPLLIKHVSRVFRLGANATDLWLAKASSIFMIAGCLMIGFSDSASTIVVSLIIFTSGSGFRQLIQSYVTSLVAPSQIAGLYTLISLLDGIGGIIAAALLSSTFATGIKLGGVMQGLPFFIAAGLYGLSSVGVWLLWAEEGDD